MKKWIRDNFWTIFAIFIAVGVVAAITDYWVG